MKYIIDIQDLWPEAFCMAVKNKFLQKLFYPMKLYINIAYSKADAIVAVSRTYVERALSVNRRISHGLCVYLGNSKELFDSGVSKYKITRTDQELWIGYVGSMGDSYDLGCIIKAISYLQTKSGFKKQLRLILCGDGEKMSIFEKMANDYGVLADFLGRKKYDRMAGILSSCDIAVNPIVKGSAASVINKVGDYAFSGIPVINTQECQEYRDLVEKYYCGINCACESEQEVARAIEYLSNDIVTRRMMGNNNRRMGEELFDRERTYNELAEMVDQMSEGKIVIIANFAGSLDGIANGRFTYLAEILAARGRDVEVITSTFNHGTKKQGKKVTGNYKSKITLIPEPGYSRNISLRRLYSHWVWGINVRKYLNNLQDKPGIVYCAIPSLTVAVQSALYCRKRG